MYTTKCTDSVLNKIKILQSKHILPTHHWLPPIPQSTRSDEITIRPKWQQLSAAKKLQITGHFSCNGSVPVSPINLLYGYTAWNEG
jgi:hypothetical protein